MTHPPYEVLVAPNRSRQKWSASLVDTTRPTTPDLERIIDKEWEIQTQRAEAEQRPLFNGRLFALHDWVEESGHVHLKLHSTNYKDFVGTNLFHGDLWGSVPPESFANPVGTSALVRTSDGLLWLGRRGDQVSFHAGHVHTFGGILEEEDLGPSGGVDLAAAMIRELQEELGIDEPKIEELIPLGMVRDRQIHQPELLFEAIVTITTAELKQLWQRAESRDEHEELVPLEDRADAVQQFLEAVSPIAPVAVAILDFHEARRLPRGTD